MLISLCNFQLHKEIDPSDPRQSTLQKVMYVQVWQGYNNDALLSQTELIQYYCGSPLFWSINVIQTHLTEILCMSMCEYKQDETKHSVAIKRLEYNGVMQKKANEG